MNVTFIENFLKEEDRVSETVFEAFVDCNFQKLSVHNVLFIERFMRCLIEINVTKNHDV